MNDKAQDELDTWILNVLGIENATFEPGRAMAVLKKCAVKEIKKLNGISINGDGTEWEIWSYCLAEYDVEAEHITKAATLELAICMFAKKVFST